MIGAENEHRKLTASHPSPEELYEVMKHAYDELIAFVVTPAFQLVLSELYSLPMTHRPAFVRTVLLVGDRLRAKGVEVPEGLLILRSAFGDRRPTLFCVKKWLPARYQVYWQNVNITFDNSFGDDDVPRDARAWRRPLPVEVGAMLIERGLTAEELGVP